MQGIESYAVQNLSSPTSIDSLVKASKGWYDGQTVVLDMRKVKTIWPGTAVYFAAALNYLRREKRIQFVADGINRKRRDTQLVDPRSIGTLQRDTYPTNRVWEYQDENEAHQITDRFMKTLTDLVVCESGVIDTLNWCIYEVLDNVFQHSQASSGFVMMQVHTERRLCVVAVADSGRGIHRAMASAAENSPVDPERLRTADAAIAHALEQGITSKGKLNQGNGLHGLRSAVEINGGTLSVLSGRGLWRHDRGEVQTSHDSTRPLLDSNSSHGTLIDWRLDCATPVSIFEALGASAQLSSIVETLQTDQEYCRIEASELEDLIGSRAQGTEIRTRIGNYLRAGASQIVLDLKGIPLVSSSFADEVMGKLALELGELEFRRRIFLENASPTNRGLIERAIALRLEAGN